MRKFYFFIILCAILFSYNHALAAEPETPQGLDTEVFFRRVKEVEVPIIMYHLVTKNPKFTGKFGITPEELENDIEYLKKSGYTTVVMQDLINFVERGKKLPKKPIMLTFDDGSGSDYHYLLPLLKKYKAKAVLSIIGEVTDRYTVLEEEKPEGRFPNLTWPQVTELHKSGLAEIQNHSFNLHKSGGSGKRKGETPENYHARLLADLQKLQESAKAYLGSSPTAFTYPFGIISEGSRAVLEELGMSGSFSSKQGINMIRQGDKDCLFRLNRINRPSGRGVERILEDLKG